MLQQQQAGRAAASKPGNARSGRQQPGGECVHGSSRLVSPTMQLGSQGRSGTGSLARWRWRGGRSRLSGCHSSSTAPVHMPAQVTVFLIGAYAKYDWPYVWVSV